MSDALSDTRREFVVTGCARSGTAYIARLLTALGIECGHEAVFTPYTRHFDGFGAVRGDSSWLAVPFLDELPAGTVVLHQVRHPDAVVRSLIGIRFFSEDRTAFVRDWRSRVQVARSRGLRESLTRLTNRDGRQRARRRRTDFVTFLHRHCPEVFTEPTERERAARYWVQWNEAAARAASRPDLVYQRYRLEDVDARQTGVLLEAMGVATETAAIDAALATLARDSNTRPPSRRAGEQDVSVTDIASVATLAGQYGYRIEAGS